jgi:ribosomal protein L12E/L44/L45/RPP1/RPP2
VKRKWNGMFSDNKDYLIIILAILLILSVIGAQFFHILIDWLQVVIDKVMIAFDKLLSGVFYSTGEVLNVSSNTVAGLAKTTINLGNGAVNDVGNLLKSASTHEVIPQVKLNQPLPAMFHRESPTSKPTKRSKKKKSEEEEEDEEEEDEEDEGFVVPKTIHQLIQQGTPMPSSMGSDPYPVGSYSSTLANMTSLFR